MSSSWVKVVGLRVCILAELLLVPSSLRSLWGLASSLCSSLRSLKLHVSCDIMQHLAGVTMALQTPLPSAGLLVLEGMKVRPFCHLVALIYTLLTKKGMQTNSISNGNKIETAIWRQLSLIKVVILPQGRASDPSYDTYLGSLAIKVRSC